MTLLNPGSNRHGPSSGTPRHNPFSTRYVRPGALPFVFASDQSPTRLVDRFLQFGGWGQIIGPHGSGKSTLLHTLIPELERRGKTIHRFTICPSQAHGRWDTAGWNSTATIVVDGYEQLSPWMRYQLHRACRKHAAGLLITSHQPTGLATVFETQVTLPVARQIVKHLLGNCPLELNEQVLQAALRRHPGNLREVLFECYDWYESQCDE